MDVELQLLEKAGFSEAEGKVYLVLLKNGAMSGYEASNQAGVPRSKIYMILESMKSKGFVIFSDQENGKQYMAVPMKEIADRVKRSTDQAMDRLSKQLEGYPKKTNMDQLWHIKEYGNVLDKCREIISTTKKELLVQVWEEDVDEILQELQSLEKQEIAISVVVFSDKKDLKLPLKKYYLHGMVEEKREEMGGRWITIVSDNRQVLFGQIIGMESAEVIWSESRPMVYLAAECVKHDVYFYKCAGMFRKEMEAVYGADLEKIRDIYDV